MKRANLILMVLGLSLTGTAWAGADPIPGVLDQFKTMTEGFSAAMIKQGGLLLAGLAGIQFTINGIKQLIKGEDLLAMTASWIQQMIVVIFFFTVITKSAIWFSYILDQWHGIGAFGAGSGPLDPGAIISMGIALIESIRSAVAAKASAGLMDFMNSAGMAFQLIFLQAFVFAAFLVLAGQLALAMIKGYLWLCVGPILLGFGGLNSTRDIAMNTMKAAISIGISILTCYVIAGIAKAAVPIWNEQIANFTIDNWVPMWNIVAVAFLLMLAAYNVPKLANDFINGTVSGGVGETLATGAAVAGAAAAGASMVTGGVAGVMKGAHSAVSALANVANQASNAITPAGGGVSAPSPQSSGGNGAAKTGSSQLGDAGDVSLSSSKAGQENPSASKGSSIADKIQEARQYIPPGGDDTVGVNANLGGNQHD